MQAIDTATGTDVVERIDDFTRGYLECALWTALGGEEHDEPIDDRYTLDDFDDASIEGAVEVCRRFQKENANDLGEARADDHNGHDFSLARNGHGTGFWDRGLGDVGDRLSKACEVFGEAYVWEDGNGGFYFDPC